MQIGIKKRKAPMCATCFEPFAFHKENWTFMHCMTFNKRSETSLQSFTLEKFFIAVNNIFENFYNEMEDNMIKFYTVKPAAYYV